MSSPLSQKETRKVLESLRDQGATLVPTKSGNRVLFPDGSTTAIHWTTSDHRATKNLRAEVLRAGLTWPGDATRNTTRVDPRRKETIRKLRAGLRKLPEEGFSSAEIREASGIGHAALAKVLPTLGYEILRDPENPRFWQWFKVKPEPKYPEIEKAKALVVTAAQPVIEAPEPIKLEVEAVRVEVAPKPAAEREFLDSEDSWTVEVPEELQVMAARFNLHIECRVWRKES